MIGLKRGSVKVVPYQAAWQELFEIEAEQLRAALGEDALQIEHVGSTAIENMDAKPILDILVAVHSLHEARRLAPVIEALGYEYKVDDEVLDRLFFIKGPASRRTHHLSLAEPTSAYWRAHILFRDYLRTHPEAAEAYRQLKNELAAQHPEDRGAYTAGKQAFVESVLERAQNEEGLLPPVPR